MNSGRNGLAIPHSFPHQLQRLIVLANSVEELSQRERVHAQMLLVAHRVRRHLLIGDAQKRARFNVVEPTILHEEFHGGTGARAFLDFIEEDERLTGNERHLREGREVRYERIGIEIAFEDLPRLGRLDEVDLQEDLVLVSAELTDEIRFPHLPRAGHEEGAPVGRTLPFQEVVIGFPLKGHTANPFVLRRVFAHYNLFLRRVFWF